MKYIQHVNEKIIKMSIAVQYVYIRHKYDLDNIKLFNSIHTIEFGQFFDQKLDNVKFPDSKHTIKFGYKFRQNITCLENTNIRAIDVRHMQLEHIKHMEIPITIKEVKICPEHRGPVKLPYGCIETIETQMICN